MSVDLIQSLDDDKSNALMWCSDPTSKSCSMPLSEINCKIFCFQVYLHNACDWAIRSVRPDKYYSFAALALVHYAIIISLQGTQILRRCLVQTLHYSKARFVQLFGPVLPLKSRLYPRLVIGWRSWPAHSSNLEDSCYTVFCWVFSASVKMYCPRHVCTFVYTCLSWPSLQHGKSLWSTLRLILGIIVLQWSSIRAAVPLQSNSLGVLTPYKPCLYITGPTVNAFVRVREII